MAEKALFSKRAFVLMYHRIISSKKTAGSYCQAGMYIRQDTFKSHLAYLTKRYRLVFLDDLIESMLRGESVGECCALTFDDGWVDNFTVAYPILVKYRAPATIFLATGFIGNKRSFWPEELAHLLMNFQTGGIQNRNTPKILKNISQFSPKSKKSNSSQWIDLAIDTLKRASGAERDGALSWLRMQTGGGVSVANTFDWEAARTMQGSGLIRFGAHSVNHVMLDQVTPHVCREEVVGSRNCIQEKLGCEVKLFAYPNGNYSPVVERIVAESGFYAAFTTKAGYLGHETPLFKIPRIGMHEDISSSLPMFRIRTLQGDLRGQSWPWKKRQAFK